MSTRIKDGLLLLSKLPNKSTLYNLISEASEYVENQLFIDVVIKFQENGQVQHPSKEIYLDLIRTIYNRPRNMLTKQELDVHVLLPPGAESALLKRPLSSKLKLCIANDTLFTDFENFIHKRYPFSDFTMKYINIPDCQQVVINDVSQTFKTYPGVVIGGTFDSVHNGHKLLLSTALLMAEKKLTVGVADEPLLKKKILKELIEPVDKRIENVVHMIEDYKPGLDHKVVPLLDSCGPSGTDDDLQLLVVSQETSGGGPIVNATRKENNLHELDVHIIDIISDDRADLSDSLNAEGKISSSGQRVRKLGVLRKQANHEKMDGKCYVIGMTGGIASGKSSVVKRMEKLGAYTIDCDKLGHQAYLPGRPAYNAIVEHFGTDILNKKKEIIRRKLGEIVFSDHKQLQTLNEIVWPEVRKMRQEIISEVEAEGKHDIVVFEGAVLFESGWDKDAHEVWCCVIPNDEAIIRLKQRNGLSEVEAEKRLAAQLSNQERVNRSHVVLSTLWEPEFTQKQVEKAWQLLCERIDVQVVKQSSL